MFRLVGEYNTKTIQKGPLDKTEQDCFKRTANLLRLPDWESQSKVEDKLNLKAAKPDLRSPLTQEIRHKCAFPYPHKCQISNSTCEYNHPGPSCHGESVSDRHRFCQFYCFSRERPNNHQCEQYYSQRRAIFTVASLNFYSFLKIRFSHTSII